MTVLHLARAVIFGLAWGYGSFVLLRHRRRRARQQVEERAHEAVMDRLAVEQLAGPDALDQLDSASLKITRKKRWPREPTDWSVVVDGKPIGTVGSGRSCVFSVAVGPHDVHLVEKDRLWSPSVSVNVGPGQTTTLICRPHYAPWQASWAILHPGRFIELSPEAEADYRAPQLTTA